MPVATRPASRPARERLLAAASELFYEAGIAATGVDAVLSRAGVSPATMYAHFPGKDALVAAYLEQRHRRWADTWDEVLRGLPDPVDRLLSVFDAVALFRRREGDRRGCAFLAAATELPPSHPGQRWLAADTRLLADRLRELAVAAGCQDADEVAARLLVLYDGTLARWARGATVADLPRGDPLTRARDLAALVVAAARPDRRPPS
jgi:AcrR family transcriptional regulator